ncbi:PTS sugar transporter subunit IIA [Shimazuella sp. AN120528]|uniref:PTS sugar transporter subunit IIA n=1 Tax=Shimazuella soli TaxID=1892854 RepID=UPI001F114470|nr:PTS sugar transporter subunit IIA [Shimazuella soli]MCH5584908.1 PTS sugar transporter subunit IIA [Shimazuella soli]
MIAEYLLPDLVQLDAQVTSREELMEYLVDLMASKGLVTDAKVYLEDLYTREKQGSTAIGFDVATPHAKSKGVSKPAIALVRLVQPIQWDEEEEVSLVFLIAVPEAQAGDVHLKIVANLFRKLMHEDFRQSLRTANSVEDILNTIQD